MNGEQLLYYLRALLCEGSNSTFVVDRLSYKFLWDGATTIAEATNCLSGTQTITTVQGQSSYALNPDFLALTLRGTDDELCIKYYDGTSTTFVSWRERNKIITDNVTTQALIPTSFTIEMASQLSRLTGTCTTGVASSLSEATLTDANANFANVYAGDTIHNLTDGSGGIVLSKTSNTVLRTALFDGTENDWDTNDSYIIQPQGRHQITLNQPSSTAGHTITVYYARKPAPVFSPYGGYEFPVTYTDALLEYAAWRYKYRDREPNFGEAFYQHWLGSLAKLMSNTNKAQSRRISVSFRSGENYRPSRG